jgi:hypothetical protein
MLGSMFGKSCRDIREQEVLQDLDTGAQERDGAVGQIICGRLAQFENRHNDGSLPNGWKVCIGDRLIEQVS